MADAPFPFGSFPVLRPVFFILSIPFVYICNTLFWDSLLKILSSLLPRDINTLEISFYGLIFVITSVFVIFAFMSSNAFYENDVPYDVIYTSDSSILLKEGTYNCIESSQSDIRQPLFGVFSAPLMGIPGAIGYFISAVPSAMIIDLAQVALLLFTIILIAAALDLTRIQRICFTVFFCSTYTYLLFSVMMEQYIIAFFWTVITVLLITRGRSEAEAVSYGAAGTLMTGVVLFPFINYGGSPAPVTKRIRDSVVHGIDLILISLIFCRLHVFINVFDSFAELRMYTGESVGTGRRILQYIDFSSGIFTAPDSGLFTGIYWRSWQAHSVNTISITGVIILILAVISIAVTRKNRLTQFAAGWVIMSFIILALVGWGTSENGLILYSLYFGWAIIILLFNLLKAIDSKLGKWSIIPPVSLTLSCAMLIYNIPAMYRLVEFAISEYH